MDSVSKLLLLGGGKITPPGQVAYTTPGTYSWTCPPGVYSVSVVCIGGGLGDSYFINATTVCGKKPVPYGNGGGYVGDGGGAGGNPGLAAQNSSGYWTGGGGGGAGGYLGNGGNGGNAVGNVNYTSHFRGGGGGGVGIFGIGTTGSGATPGSGGASGGTGGDAIIRSSGSGGVGGSNGSSGNNQGLGGTYGGGGSGLDNASGGAGLGWKNNIPVVPGQTYTVLVGGRGIVLTNQGDSGGGAVRIIWAGDQRQFPSTKTGDE